MGKETTEKLSDKELHCIARMLQSAWRAPEQETIPVYRMFYGCWYCKYSHECKMPSGGMDFRKAMDKLGRVTGVNICPVCDKGLGSIFLPASVFIKHPEELKYLEKYHPEEYQFLQKCLDQLLHSPGELLPDV